MKIRFFFSDNSQKNQILSALNLISSQTCIKFVQLFPGFNEQAYVLIRSGGGCSSEVGYRAGAIHMSLNIEVFVK
jgi:Astacin (Peptidase family M12A)